MKTYIRSISHMGEEKDVTNTNLLLKFFLPSMNTKHYYLSQCGGINKKSAVPCFTCDEFRMLFEKQTCGLLNAVKYWHTCIPHLDSQYEMNTFTYFWRVNNGMINCKIVRMNSGIPSKLNLKTAYTAYIKFFRNATLDGIGVSTFSHINDVQATSLKPHYNLNVIRAAMALTK